MVEILEESTVKVANGHVTESPQGLLFEALRFKRRRSWLLRVIV